MEMKAMEDTLFPLPEGEEKATEQSLRGRVRLKRANRVQMEWQLAALESLLAEDHKARIVWEWVQGVDVSPLEAEVKAVEGQAGQNAIDPRILLGLWLLATIEGVGSARALDRLCEENIGYRWLRGGVSVNYHTLADFRVAHEAFLEQQLVDGVAALMTEGLVQLEIVAQDGKKVRASAGSSSFSSDEKLEARLAMAEEQVKTLRQELETDPGATTRRQKAARERAARERVARLEEARKELAAKKAQAEKSGRAKQDAKNPRKKHRASRSDPQARIMKMANGGFNPAYNAQFCTDVASNIIVGLAVSQQGNDTGLASPMLAQLEADYDQRPTAILADTSYASHDEITTITQQGTTPYIAIPIKGNHADKVVEDAFAPHKGDTPQVLAWRERLASPEGQQILKQRGQVAELVHAVLDQMNLARLRVRGLRKVRTVLLWFALAHNLLRERLLRQHLAQASAR
jgi:transposase